MTADIIRGLLIFPAAVVGALLGAAAHFLVKRRKAPAQSATLNFDGQHCHVRTHIPTLKTPAPPASAHGAPSRSWCISRIMSRCQVHQSGSLYRRCEHGRPITAPPPLPSGKDLLHMTHTKSPLPGRDHTHDPQFGPVLEASNVCAELPHHMRGIKFKTISRGQFCLGYLVGGGKWVHNKTFWSVDNNELRGWMGALKQGDTIQLFAKTSGLEWSHTINWCQVEVIYEW
ncbi:hypothetical protein FN846DRAFT_1003089 [Sphaerosporella brunnea]|uniref:Uncharacterized protein n=1 Tax=Sphaerosporella brunnea TaxID=1250544 RepID=A0A5J5FAW0_9PEZI|nr:hypothetical protein FN846DRAFT_1003089 [Sphaerosporella brunnea]